MLSRLRFVGRDQDLLDLSQHVSRPRAVAVISGEAGVGKSRLLEELRRVSPREFWTFRGQRALKGTAFGPLTHNISAMVEGHHEQFGEAMLDALRPSALLVGQLLGVVLERVPTSLLCDQLSKAEMTLGLEPRSLADLALLQSQLQFLAFEYASGQVRSDTKVEHSRLQQAAISYLGQIGREDLARVIRMAPAEHGAADARGAQVADVTSLAYALARAIDTVINEGHQMTIVVEDAQWHDTATKTILSTIQALTTAPLSFIVAIRAPSSEAIGDEFVRRIGDSSKDCLWVKLNRLKPADLAPAITSLLRDETALAQATNVAQQVATRSDGNPLFAQELVRHYQRSGTLDSIPPSIAASYVERLAVLTEQSRQVLELLAVLGDGVPYWLALRVARSARISGFSGGVQGLLLDGLIYKTRRSDLTPGEEFVYFDHALLEEVVMQQLDVARFQKISKVAGRTFASLAADPTGADAERVAIYFLNANSYAQSIDYLLLNAYYRLTISDYEGAQASADHVLEVRSKGRGVGLAHLIEGDAYRGLADWGSAHIKYRAVITSPDQDLLIPATVRKNWNRFLGVVPSDNDPGWRSPPSPRRILSEAHLGAARCMARRGDWANARRGLAVANLLVSRGDHRQRLRILRHEAWLMTECEQYAEAEGSLVDALRLADRDAFERGRVLSDLCRVNFLSGAMRAGANWGAEALEASSACEDLAGVAVVANNLGRLCHAQGQWARALHLFAIGAASTDRRPDSMTQALISSNVAKLLLDLSDVSTAMSHAEEFVEFCQTTGYRYGESVGRSTLARCLASIGDETASKHELQVAHGLAQETAVGLGHVYLAEARCLALLGQDESAFWVAMDARKTFEGVDRYEALHSLLVAVTAAPAKYENMIGEAQYVTRGLRESIDSQYPLLAAGFRKILRSPATESFTFGGPDHLARMALESGALV